MLVRELLPHTGGCDREPCEGDGAEGGGGDRRDSSGGLQPWGGAQAGYTGAGDGGGGILADQDRIYHVMKLEV